MTENNTTGKSDKAVNIGRCNAKESIDCFHRIGNECHVPAYYQGSCKHREPSDFNMPSQVVCNTTEELLPCSHCDSVAILRETENRWGDTCYVVKCSNGEDCAIETMMFRNKHEAIGAWNRRVAEKPKWTEEPKEPGEYWVYRPNYPGEPVICVRLFMGKGKLRVLVRHFVERLDKFREQHADAKWLKIDVPALPEEGEMI